MNARAHALASKRVHIQMIMISRSGVGTNVQITATICQTFYNFLMSCLIEIVFWQVFIVSSSDVMNSVCQCKHYQFVALSSIRDTSSQASDRHLFFSCQILYFLVRKFVMEKRM